MAANNNIELTFENCVILESTARTSQSGNPFTVLRFLCTDDMGVYEVLCFGDAGALALGLQPTGDFNSPMRLDFAVRPNGGSAGVRLTLVGAGRSGLSPMDPSFVE